MPHTRPLSGLEAGAYRPQRLWQLEGVIGPGGYAMRLPEPARRWLEGYLLEAYGVEGKRVRAGLHADVPRRAAGGTRYQRRAWAAVVRRWPHLTEEQREEQLHRARAWGLTLRWDTSARRALYREQNASRRCVLAMGRAVPLEEAA